MVTILEYIQKSGFSMSEIADLSGLSRAYAFIVAKDGIKKISRNKLMQLAIGLNLSLAEIESLLDTYGHKKIEWSDFVDALMVVRGRKISGTQPIFSGFSQLLSLMTIELMPGELICLGSNLLDVFIPDFQDNWRPKNSQSQPKEDVHSGILLNLCRHRKTNLESHLRRSGSIKLLLSEGDVQWYIQNQEREEILSDQFREIFSWTEKFPKFEIILIEDSASLQYELKLYPTKESKGAAIISSLGLPDFSVSGHLVGIFSRENSIVHSVQKECERFSPVGEIKEIVKKLIGIPLNSEKSS